MTTINACEKFANGLSGKANSVESTGDRIYSYNTVIGYWKDGKVYLNTAKYSVTTSKHQSYLRRSLKGVETIEYTPKNHWLGI